MQKTNNERKKKKSNTSAPRPKISNTLQEIREVIIDLLSATAPRDHNCAKIQVDDREMNVKGHGSM